MADEKLKGGGIRALLRRGLPPVRAQQIWDALTDDEREGCDLAAGEPNEHALVTAVLDNHANRMIAQKASDVVTDQAADEESGQGTVAGAADVVTAGMSAQKAIDSVTDQAADEDGTTVQDRPNES